MGCFCVKEQARVERSVRLKHFLQGVHPEQMFTPPQNHHRRKAGRHTRHRSRTDGNKAHTVNTLSPFLFHILKKLEKTL